MIGQVKNVSIYINQKEGDEIALTFYYSLVNASKSLRVERKLTKNKLREFLTFVPSKIKATKVTVLDDKTLMCDSKNFKVLG